MRKKEKKLSVLILTGALCATIISGCVSAPSPEASETPSASGTGQTVYPESSESSAASTLGASETSVGSFSTQDVFGNSFDQKMFEDYELTLVNIFTTWCTPCVEEMPDLEQLYQQMKDQGVTVVGVVLDVLNENGEIVQSDLERAQTLAERTGVTYPILLPDSTYMNGRLTGIEGFPETFFVDKNGNIVGETYSGSRSLEDWLTIVEQELAALKEGN